MRMFTAILVAALIPSAAMAEDDASKTALPAPDLSAPPQPAPKPPYVELTPEHEFRLGTNFGMMYSQSDKYRLTSYQLLFAPEYEWDGRLVVTGLLRMTTTKIDMHGTDAMPFDASLSLPWQVSLGAGFRYRVWRHRLVDFSLFGQFEFPLNDNTADIDSFKLYGDAAQYMPDIDVLRKHAEVKHLWRRLSIGTTVRGHFGRWRPFLDLGYVNGQNRIVATFDQQASDLFAQAKISPKRFYDNDQSSFFYAAGTDVDVGAGIRLHLIMTVLPTGGGVYAQGEIGIVVPISIPTTWK